MPSQPSSQHCADRDSQLSAGISGTANLQSVLARASGLKHDGVPAKFHSSHRLGLFVRR